MSGWIKIHRKITEWEWYDDTNTFRLFLHILLKANHKDKKYRGKVVKKGCLLTGRDLLSEETGLSVRQVRTCLERLKSTNELTIKSTSQGTEIQVVKYNEYQLATSETTNKRPTNDQQTTTNKNVKNIKNIFIVPTIEDVKEYCLERKNDVDANKFINFYASKGWMVGKNKMKDWRAAVRTWEKDKSEATLNNQKTIEQMQYEHIMKQMNQ